MALVNGANYDHTDLQSVVGGDTVRHMLQDTSGRAMLASLEAGATAAAAHAPGTASQYFVYGDTLYRAMDNIAIGDSIVTSGSGQNCEAVTIGGDLGKLIHDLLYFDPIELVDNDSAINTNVNVGDSLAENIANPTTPSGLFYKIVPCAAGDRFLITGKGGTNPRLWAFTDGEYKLIDKATATLTLSNAELIAPNDGYLICNFYANESYALAKLKIVTGEDFLALKTQINAIAATITA